MRHQKSRVHHFAAAAVGALALTSLALTNAGASTGSDQQFVAFTASNGASSNYHYYPSGKAGSGLLVYLDGDGQWGHDNPSDSYALGGSKGIVAQARARGLDVMSVKSPDRSGEITWWEDCSRNEVYFKELLNKVKADKGINGNDIWITGFSGGAQFTTQCYLPKDANTIGGGGTIVFGGGGKPYTTVTPFTQETKKALDLHWITGADDTAANSSEGYDALAYAKAGQSYYAQQGFQTYMTWPKGIDHDEIGGQFGTYIGKALDISRSAQPSPAPSPTSTPSATPTVKPSPTPTPTTAPTSGAWKTSVSVGRDYADVKVNIPADAASKTTTVYVYGPNGTYWYEEISGTGSKTVRMGDPGDMLKPGTNYTYKVVNNKTTQAKGKFTTR